MTWAFLGQTFAGGLLLGGIYALLASSVTLIFGVMRVINFAQADFMMLGMLMAFALNHFFGLDLASHLGGRFLDQLDARSNLQVGPGAAAKNVLVASLHDSII